MCSAEIQSRNALQHTLHYRTQKPGGDFPLFSFSFFSLSVNTLEELNWDFSHLNFTNIGIFHREAQMIRWQPRE